MRDDARGARVRARIERQMRNPPLGSLCPPSRFWVDFTHRRRDRETGEREQWRWGPYRDPTEAAEAAAKARAGFRGRRVRVDVRLGKRVLSAAQVRALYDEIVAAGRGEWWW